MSAAKIMDQLLQDDFISNKGFIKLRFNDERFTSLGTTVVNNSGREITIVFSIYDDSPDIIELNIEFRNKCSVEQIKVIGEKIAEKHHRKLELYGNGECTALVSLFAADEIEKSISMMKDILEEVNKVLIFLVK